MRRTALLGLSATLAVGLAVGGAQAAKPKKLTAKVEIEGTEFVSPDLIYFGDVAAKKNKCERNRHVTLYYDTDPGPGEELQDAGDDVTDRTGDFEIAVELLGTEAYYAVVDKRRIGRGDQKLVCKAATSEPFVPEV